MGTTLTGTQINNTYDGLIKVTDNGPIGATAKTLTDGLGNDACIALGTAGTTFTGTADFTGATVTGITDNNTTYDLASAQAGSNVNVNLTGSDATTDTVTLAAGTNITLTDNGSCQITIDSTAGLVAGTGTDSIKVADSLVNNAATASGNCSIAIGDGACAGLTAVAIGTSACVTGAGVAVGNGADAGGLAISIGDGSSAPGSSSIGMGYNSNAVNACSIAIGNTAVTSANGAVALGQGVTAATADTVSVKALETQTNSTPTAGGIIMSDAGGTDRRLNITAAGGLQIDSTPVGGGGSAGLVAGTGTDSMKNADSLVTTPAVAACPGSIALGNGATANPAFGTDGSIAIGCNASTLRGGVVLIGGGATASDANSTVIGYNATGANNSAIAIGESSCANNKSVAIGVDRKANAGTVAIGAGASFINVGICSVAIGLDAGYAGGICSVMIGRNATAKANCSVAIGQCSRIDNNIGNAGSILIGNSTLINSDNLSGAIAIGASAQPTAINAIAIGPSVTASRQDTLTTCQLEACEAGKGIVVTSPDGLTTLGIGIDNTGAIVTYTP